MNWFNYGDTTYYAQLVFNNKQDIVLRAKLESSIITTKKSKQNLLSFFKEKL